MFKGRSQFAVLVGLDIVTWNVDWRPGHGWKRNAGDVELT